MEKRKEIHPMKTACLIIMTVGPWMAAYAFGRYFS